MYTRYTMLGRFLVLTTLVILLSACSTQQYLSELKHGPSSAFDKVDIATVRADQDQVLVQLCFMGGVIEPSATTPACPAATDMNAAKWDKVIAAGMNYADAKCEKYMHALFRLNRTKRTTINELGLVGTAAAGVMAAAKSAAEDVALTAILFGLAGTTVDNLTNNVLYELDPSSVRTLVLTLHSTFRDSLGGGYNDRPAAIGVIQAYARLCVPENIEAEVNLAVKKAQPVDVSTGAKGGKAPIVTNSGGEIKAGTDHNPALLMNFAFPEGKSNTDNTAKLQAWLTGAKITAGINEFIAGATYAEQRADAVKYFQLK